MHRNVSSFVCPWCACLRLLGAARVQQAPVLEHNRLGETGRAARKIYRGVVVLRHLEGWRARRAVVYQRTVRLSESRTILADVEPRPDLRDAVHDLLDAAGELRAEHQCARVGKLEAVLDLVRRIAEIERHGHAARLEDAEVDRKPLKAVHQQDRDLVASLVSAREEEVGEPVRLLVEVAPRHVGAVCPVRNGLDELRLLPGLVPAVVRRVDLHQSDIARPFRCVALEYLGDVLEFSVHGHLLFGLGLLLVRLGLLLRLFLQLGHLLLEPLARVVLRPGLRE